MDRDLNTQVNARPNSIAPFVVATIAESMLISRRLIWLTKTAVWESAAGKLPVRNPLAKEHKANEEPREH
ncbi:MAG: hypothetical protein FJ217_08685 [Ignavibacteria bacterium]|nr:hypothetical protein [Ignavibacteria bacterium]